MMRRLLVLAGALIVAAACRTYQNYPPLAEQDGLIPADQWAAYGAEQAQAVAIGRAFGDAYGGIGTEARARQVAAAVAAAESAGAQVVEVDTAGYRVTVRFASGWVKAILPIGN